MKEWGSSATLEHPAGAVITPGDTVLSLLRFPAGAAAAPTRCWPLTCALLAGAARMSGTYTVSAFILGAALEPLDDACAMMVHALEVRSGAGADMRDR